jgi:hypothetical protein
MTRLEIQNAVKKWILKNPDITDAEIQAVINKVYLSIAIPFRFHEIETIAYLNVVSGTKTYALTTATLYALHAAYDREYGKELEVVDPWDTDVRADDEGITEGAPEKISRYGGNVYLYPTPDYTLTQGVKLYGVALPIALASDGASPVYPEDWHFFIELQSAATCSFMLGNDERGQLLQNLALGQLAGRQESHTIEAFIKAMRVTAPRMGGRTPSNFDVTIRS